MSNVIQLDLTNRKIAPRVAPDGTTAEIVIFHGVRVERLTDDMMQQNAPRASRRLPSLSNQATATELE